MNWRPICPLIVLLIFVCLSFLSIYLSTKRCYFTCFEQLLKNSNLDLAQRKSGSTNSADVLLIYVYANTHPHALGNLRYFIEMAVRENDGVDYYFILQRINNKVIDEGELPLLVTRNAQYIQHDNVCFDIGTFGWFINIYTHGNPWINQTANRSKTIDLNTYKYFILLNSSVRGPFFPPYFNEFSSNSPNMFGKSYSWYQIYTQRLNDKVKLVGSTISCQITPHVQSYVLVTDWIGLKILLKPGSDGGSHVEGIFRCYTKQQDVSEFSEVVSSTRILQSGYMIDSLLTKYNGVDFKDKRNHGCDRSANPYVDRNLDGQSLEPYEVVFVKFNDIDFLQVPKDRARLYDAWARDTRKRIRTNF